MVETIPAVIFAGGKSSRMGQDKALLPFDKYNSLAHYQYDKLQTIFKSVYISTKENKFDFDAHFIYDTYDIYSPLSAIVSVLEYTKCPTFIISVDMPFMIPDIINELIVTNDTQHIATIAKSLHGLEPLCGIYNPSFIQLAQKEIQNNNHKINYILKQNHIKIVNFKEDNAFLNLNYPSDYQNALKLC